MEGPLARKHVVRAFSGLAILIHAQSAEAQSEISSEDIEAIQQQLGENGYHTGDVDGQLGSKTAEAVRMYQSDWKLSATGDISPELIDRIPDKHPATQSKWFTI